MIAGIFLTFFYCYWFSIIVPITCSISAVRSFFCFLTLRTIAKFFFCFSCHVLCLPSSIWIWILTVLAAKCCFLFVFIKVSLHLWRSTLWFCGLSWLFCTGFSCILTTQLNPTRSSIRRLALTKPIS